MLQGFCIEIQQGKGQVDPSPPILLVICLLCLWKMTCFFLICLNCCFYFTCLRVLYMPTSLFTTSFVDRSWFEAKKGRDPQQTWMLKTYGFLTAPLFPRHKQTSQQKLPHSLLTETIGKWYEVVILYCNDCFPWKFTCLRVKSQWFLGQIIAKGVFIGASKIVVFPCHFTNKSIVVFWMDCNHTLRLFEFLTKNAKLLAGSTTNHQLFVIVKSQYSMKPPLVCRKYPVGSLHIGWRSPPGHWSCLTRAATLGDGIADCRGQQVPRRVQKWGFLDQNG